MEVKSIMYPDIIMKNILILGGCLLIIFYLVHREEAVREKQKLNRELETEKEFRESFHSNSLLTYCANITKERFVKEKSEFILPEVGGYQESMMEKEQLPTLVFWPGEFHGLYSINIHTCAHKLQEKLSLKVIVYFCS